MSKSRWGKSILLGLAGILVTACQTTGTPVELPHVWNDHAVNQKTSERYIPVALWTGGPWDGKKNLKPHTPVSKTHYYRDTSSRSPISDAQITGPEKFSHPLLNKEIDTFKRNRPKQDYYELWAVNSFGDALGRVKNTRFNHIHKDKSQFPLGVWKQGEVREYTATELQGNGNIVKRKLLIEILDIDFTYGRVPHSIRYRWTNTATNGRVLANNVYIYSPERGLVHTEQR